MNNTEKLIAELRAWKSKWWGVLCQEKKLDEFHEILSHHTPKPKDEGGLREALEGYLKEVGVSAYTGMPTDHLKMLLTIHPAPTDRQEALAVLADKYICGVRVNIHKLDLYPKDVREHRRWSIVLMGHEFDLISFMAPTYEAAEAKARQYLESLNDKKEGKK